MSDAGSPPPTPDLPPAMPAPTAPPPRSGWLTALMAIVGVILLLPGLCAVIFGVMSASHPDPMVSLLVMLGLLVGVGGILLIRAAIRGRQP